MTAMAMAATTSAVVLMASCAEEDLSWSDKPWSDILSEQQTAILPVDDLTFGCNSIITETDSLTSVRIPLNTDIPAQVSCRHGYADLQCVKVDGKYYLQVANPFTNSINQGWKEQIGSCPST